MIEEFVDAVSEGTVDTLQNTRANRYTHILVLREVASPSRFTTDGERLNVTTMQTGYPHGDTSEITAVDLFHRKQPGAERRTAKMLERDILSDEPLCAEDRMHPNEMNQDSPESILFGSAAGDAGVNQRSRVYYDTAYSLRDRSVVSRQEHQNASRDTFRERGTEMQGVWSPGFVEPGTFFPSIVSLDTGTPQELLFLLAVIQRTRRYGSASTRGGVVRNHVLGVYPSTFMSPSNWELNRWTVGSLLDSEVADSASDLTSSRTLQTPVVSEAVRDAYHDIREEHGVDATPLPSDLTDSVLDALMDDDTLRDVMQVQFNQSQDFVANFNADDD